MIKILTPNLKTIFGLELDLGNSISFVHDVAPLPLVVVFKEPIHREEIELSMKVQAPTRWHNMGSFAGYVDEDTGQSIQGPALDIADIEQSIRHKLAHSLQLIYDLELYLGNLVDQIEEPAGDSCSLAITFKYPMHKRDIESALLLPSSVKWWECHDSHYPIQGGYACEDTRHVIAGPLEKK